MKTIDLLASVIFQTATSSSASTTASSGGSPFKDILGYACLTLIFLFGLVILYKIIRGTIDINLLLQESGGGASMSRFQLLIFTFVIAVGLLLIVVSKTDFPDIPVNVLALIGVSATTYGVSKGIQAGGGLDPKGGKSADENKQKI